LLGRPRGSPVEDCCDYKRWVRAFFVAGNAERLPSAGTQLAFLLVFHQHFAALSSQASHAPVCEKFSLIEPTKALARRSIKLLGGGSLPWSYEPTRPNVSTVQWYGGCESSQAAQDQVAIRGRDSTIATVHDLHRPLPRRLAAPHL